MKSLNLVLHAGGQRASFEQVQSVATPPASGIWRPISHHSLYNQVTSALGTLNMRVIEEQHALTPDGNRYFGLLQVANCLDASDDFSYVLGIRNSHDKRFPAGLVVGSGVFVCDNLSFSGEIKIARKHTTHIERDLPELTGRAVGQLAEKWHTMAERFSVYKEKELSETQAHDVMIRAMDLGACTNQQMPKILREWRSPSHPEFVASGRTAWRLFNAFTEVAKGNSVFTTAKRSQSLHGIMDAECGIITKSE